MYVLYMNYKVRDCQQLVIALAVTMPTTCQICRMSIAIIENHIHNCAPKRP